MKKQDMNLLDSYNRVAKTKANESSVARIYIMIVIGAILITGAFYAKLQFDQFAIDSQINDIGSFVNSPQNLARNEEAVKLREDINDLEVVQSKIESAFDVINFMPLYESSIIELILAERPGTVSINGIDFLNGIISLDVSGTRVYSVSDYVLRLRRLNYFESVDYSGYTLENDQYNASILLILKGGR